MDLYAALRTNANHRAAPGEEKKAEEHTNEIRINGNAFFINVCENCLRMYLACYGFAYYKADPEHITMEVFDGMIDAICKCDTMKNFYKGRNCFDQKEIDKYVKGSERSKKKQYPMDWLFDFSYDLSVPEYYVTHRECGVCKIAQQENLMFLMPHMCVMDYPTIEYKGGKLIRTKTLGAGDDCCNFHVVKDKDNKKTVKP